MILVVDDSEMVRTMAAAALRQRGYVVMPRVGGPALARALKSCHPETMVLFMSGFPQDRLAKSGVA